MKIAILGAGAWGTALAINLSASHQVTLWTRDPGQLAELVSHRVNRRYLPDLFLPDSLRLTSELDSAVKAAEFILMAIPVAGLRELLQKIRGTGRALPVILGCKGFEVRSAMLPHQVVREVYSATAPYGILSGPSFAQEVARGLPTALTLASDDDAFSKYIIGEIHTTYLRIYSSSDVVGVETAGAIKNVIAIATGISDGLKLGNNARAALITRGLAEITRMGVALGGCRETFMGLAGIGDLILTCTGDMSRNRQVGMMLAAGQLLPEILQKIGHVAEGVHTAREAEQMSRRLKIEMPVTQAVCSIIYDDVPAERVVKKILDREPKTEFD
ncbi:NAD(P)H-dependent glycerol-3-phosphate dehydrogenase [Nitrosomonas sp. Nm132]|jgi:glycerol-3-phosphate dehydrogenase (NAD(P)+)|uniref:NAD(P)H-dependent glycerol-3-phosphate dehydrogenase n=1 Tax=Nitrosomonas sp. Nm132 TaxID=1881053 RepID=UPI00088ED1A7|nr:NAD(P)H-dependent glycerol-3-phosphate dehydrogenase [Nitrosomonas sp. Nm132]SDH59108.1 glycerol-3-phosphate dehydrogenase (NAD(P)+) [Nitrosomonas sp. Nm132]